MAKKYNVVDPWSAVAIGIGVYVGVALIGCLGADVHTPIKNFGNLMIQASKPKPSTRKTASRKSVQSKVAVEAATMRPVPAGMTRYRGYLIHCSGETFCVSLAGDELVRQLYPGAKQRVGAGNLDGWMLEQAKAYVDAKRAGHV